MNLALRRALNAAVVVILAASMCATARAEQRSGAAARVTTFVPPTGLIADASRAGVVNLFFLGPPGTRVYFDERVGQSVKRLGSTIVGPAAWALFPEAVVWRCDRLVRSFEATALRPNGTRTYGKYDVRTPSCATRFEIDAPRRVAPRKVVRIRMIDGWEIGGIKPRLCITAPGGRRTCEKVRFERAVILASRHFRATKRGLWRVVLRVGDKHEVRTTVAVGGSVPLPPRLPIVLATGDSTMQGVDSFLTDGMADTATVRSDVFIGTGVSSTLGWVKRAPQQARRHRPRATVISIGANDSSGMETPAGEKTACCSEAWVAEYARRVRAMMKAYIRKARGRVFWLTLPAARDPLRAMYGAVVNVAIRRAAAGLDRATVVPIDQIFTPNGYRDVMRWRGNDVHVRALDGIHLSAAGTAIAAEIVQSAIGDL